MRLLRRWRKMSFGLVILLVCWRTWAEQGGKEIESGQQLPGKEKDNSGLPSIADLMDKWLHADRFEEPWRPATSGPFVTFTAPVVDKGGFVIQPLFFYNFVRGEYDKHSRFHSLPDGDMRQSAVLSLFMQYGILKDTEIDAQLNVVHNRVKESGQRASATGLADTQVALRTVLLHETSSWHPEVTWITQLELPTGKYQHGDPDKLGTDIMGGGSVDLTLGLDFTKSLKPFVFHADLWYTIPFERRIDGVRTRYGDALIWNTAVEIPFCKERLAYMLEFNGLHQGNTRENGVEIGGSRVNQVMFGTGLELVFSDRAQLLLGYQRVIWGTNTDATDTLGATLVLTF